MKPWKNGRIGPLILTLHIAFTMTPDLQAIAVAMMPL